MTQSHEWWGVWWLPNNEATQFGGRATFDPKNGVSLRLAGGFDHMIYDEPAPGVRSFSGETRHFPIVLGRANGKPITLLDCNVSSSNGPLLGEEPWDQTLTARMLLHGYHLLEADSPEFVSLENCIENLPQFAANSAIRGQVKFGKESSGRGSSATYEVSAIEVRDASFEGNRYVLGHTYAIPKLDATRTRHEVHLWDMPSITIEFPKPVSVKQATASAHPIRDLVTLAIGRPCGIISQRLFVAPVPGRYPDHHPLATRKIPVTFFTVQGVRARPNDEPAPQHEVMFTLDDAPFETLLPEWLRTHRTFRAASNLLFGMQYSTEQYLESRVIAAVAAAESFHRALNPEPPIPEDDFTDLRRAAADAVPEQYRAEVFDRFRRNEPSLKARLLDLASRLDPSVATRIVPDQETWAKRTRDSRNTLAHEGTYCDGEFIELYAVAEVTATVVMLNLLRVLGIPPERIAAKIAENQNLMRAARLAEEHLCSYEQIGSP